MNRLDKFVLVIIFIIFPFVAISEPSSNKNPSISNKILVPDSNSIVPPGKQRLIYKDELGVYQTIEIDDNQRNEIFKKLGVENKNLGMGHKILVPNSNSSSIVSPGKQRLIYKNELDRYQTEEVNPNAGVSGVTIRRNLSNIEKGHYDLFSDLEKLSKEDIRKQLSSILEKVKSLHHQLIELKCLPSDGNARIKDGNDHK